MESSLEVYSGDVSREINMLDLIYRGMEVLGPKARELDMVMQWMKDQGLEGYPKYEYPRSSRSFTPHLTPEQILVRLSQTPIPPSGKNLPIKNTQPKKGRNSPCSCGSGLKFKKCCGKH
jgi:hypothetical protein